MSHSWSAEARVTGLIDASDETVALGVRDAQLALEATAATAQDAAAWAALVSEVNTVLTAIDPAHTGSSRIQLLGSGLHSGFAAASCGLTIEFRQSGGQMTDPHHLTFDTDRALTAPDVALAQAYIEAVQQARGHTFTGEDDVVFTALVEAAQDLTQLLEPGLSGVVRISGSALVNPGLDAAQLSLQVSSTQPQPAESPAASLPAGAIIAFRGLVIPAGWRLCDGTNGTPDLRGRFIIGDTLPGLGSAAGTADPTAGLTHAVTQPDSHATGNTGTSGGGRRFVNDGAAAHTGTAVAAHPILSHYRLVYIIKE